MRSREPTPLQFQRADRISQKNLAEKAALSAETFPDIAHLMDPDELAGMATEPHIESRLISCDQREKNWRLEHGPFEPQIFSELPPTHWTLLVQDVDKWIPEIAELFDHFSFLSVVAIG